MEVDMEPHRDMLRHTLATLAYRGAKAVRGAPPEFAGFRAGPTTRTPGEILAHVGDLLDWALRMAMERPVWKDSPVLSWEEGSARFFRSLEALEAFLASDQDLAAPPERIFQGPIADALTHVGQINLLRRLFGAPVRGENYARATINAGTVGRDQPAPAEGAEFD
jgi:hypothetical protein